MTDAPKLCCSNCKGPRDNPRQRLCRVCHAAYMRAWRAKEARERQRRRAILKGVARETVDSSWRIRAVSDNGPSNG